MRWERIASTPNMMQGYLTRSALLFAEWWYTVRRTEKFPIECKYGFIYLIYRRGVQIDTANYSPIYLLSKISITLKIQVPSLLYDQFTPPLSPFGFQVGISVTQSRIEDSDKMKQ